ncbi:hypothetical protein [Lacticaseibacillus jixiensis]|uniref:hypothetical protein n=1 Tax=Lacticaseibacillus jixiensis TaxID=3231926 RepID=UPI0036F24B92
MMSRKMLLTLVTGISFCTIGFPTLTARATEQTTDIPKEMISNSNESVLSFTEEVTVGVIVEQMNVPGEGWTLISSSKQTKTINFMNPALLSSSTSYQDYLKTWDGKDGMKHRSYVDVTTWTYNGSVLATYTP